MYNVAICEDDAAARKDLSGRCADVLSKLGMPCEISGFSSAEELEDALNKRAENFDLILLDIVLPGKTGISLGTSIRRLDDEVSIIFITGSAEYALEGYGAQPCNYLLKPVSDASLTKALKQELKRHNKHQTVVFQDKGRVVRLPARDIIYLESYDHGIRVFTKREVLTFFMPLTQAQTMLPPGMFARCHNSFLVNLLHIQTASSTKVVLQSGAELPVGRKYRDDFHRLFISHFF